MEENDRRRDWKSGRDLERSWSLYPKQDHGDASWKPYAPEVVKGNKSGKSIFPGSLVNTIWHMINSSATSPTYVRPYLSHEMYFRAIWGKTTAIKSVGNNGPADWNNTRTRKVSSRYGYIKIHSAQMARNFPSDGDQGPCSPTGYS
jgi:hypothetical protein